jgi:hypothetical protein
MWNLYQGAKDATLTCQVTRDSEIKAAEAQRATMEVRNKESLGKLNRDHAKKLADAISNARINWGTVSLPSQSSVSGSDTLPPLSACPSDAAIGQLLVNCATDANTIAEFQRWITLNRIPVAEDE